MPGVLIHRSHGAGRRSAGAQFHPRPRNQVGAARVRAEARFRKPVRPGDQLVIEMTVDQAQSHLAKMSGVGESGRRRRRRSHVHVPATGPAHPVMIHPSAIVDAGAPSMRRPKSARFASSARTSCTGAHLAGRHNVYLAAPAGDRRGQHVFPPTQLFGVAPQDAEVQRRAFQNQDRPTATRSANSSPSIAAPKAAACSPPSVTTIS